MDIETAKTLMLFLSAGVNLYLGWQFRKIGKRARDLSQNSKSYRELSKVIRDLNQLGGGMVEIRRVDPSSVFLYQP